MIDRHMVIHGDPEGEHTRVEIDYTKQEIIIADVLSDMGFRYDTQVPIAGYIADFFVHEILGGGELNNEELIKLLEKEQYDIKKINSQYVNLDFLKQNDTLQ